MTEKLLYLSRAQVEQLVPARNALRAALAQAVQDTAAQRLKFEPKTTLTFATGHSFQAMPALVSDEHGKGLAAVKWVSVVPTRAQSKLDNIHSVICVNDLATGQPLAIMDGNYITLVRTAALSALAAQYMLASKPLSIGFVGCGQQAREHLLAFLDLYPSLHQVFCISRSEESAQKLATFAQDSGLEAQVTSQADDVLANCDIIISTVPSAPGFTPFLDARKMRANALAIMVDLGRSWQPEGFSAFDHIATDSLLQSQHPYDNEGKELSSVQVNLDLEILLAQPLNSVGRKAFFFKGIAPADLAVAALVYHRAIEQNCGSFLER